MLSAAAIRRGAPTPTQPATRKGGPRLLKHSEAIMMPSPFGTVYLAIDRSSSSSHEPAFVLVETQPRPAPGTLPMQMLYDPGVGMEGYVVGYMGRRQSGIAVGTRVTIVGDPSPGAGYVY